MSDNRQRAFFYLGTDLKKAVGRAVELKSQWREIWKRGGSLTVWPLGPEIAHSPAMAKLTPQEIQSAIGEYHVEATADALESGVEQQKTTMRLEQVRDAYLEYRKSKLGICDGQGINERSYTNESRNLKGGLSVVDPRMTINGFGYAEIERLRDDIFR